MTHTQHISCNRHFDTPEHGNSSGDERSYKKKQEIYKLLVHQLKNHLFIYWNLLMEFTAFAGWTRGEMCPKNGQ
jgi:hypothetical protein